MHAWSSVIFSVLKTNKKHLPPSSFFSCVCWERRHLFLLAQAAYALYGPILWTENIHKGLICPLMPFTLTVPWCLLPWQSLDALYPDSSLMLFTLTVTWCLLPWITWCLLPWVSWCILSWQSLCAFYLSNFMHFTWVLNAFTLTVFWCILLWQSVTWCLLPWQSLDAFYPASPLMMPFTLIVTWCLLPWVPWWLLPWQSPDAFYPESIDAFYPDSHLMSFTLTVLDIF